MNATAPTVAIGAPSPAPSATHCSKPLLGVVTLSLGAFLSGLNTRLTTFGVADIRGGVGLGFDEGSWLTAVMTALVWHAMPRECIYRALLQQTDWRGLALVGIGLAMIYARLDQGNHLD